MPFSALRKVVHTAPEVTYGTAPVFAAANTFVAEDFEVSPMEGEMVERVPHSADFGTRRKKAGPRYASVKFKVALVARAAVATPAPYRAALLAARMAETVTAGTSVTYSPVASGFGSMALLYNQDGEARTITGIRGGVGLTFEKGAVPYLNFEGFGLTGVRAAAAAVAQDYTAWGEPDLITQANTTFSLGGVALALESLDIGVDNIFGYRNRPNQQAITAERKPDQAASLSVLDEVRAGFDPEAWLRNETTQVLDLQHGTAVGRRARVLANAVQVAGYAETEMDGEAGLDLELQLTSALGATADFSLVLS